MSLLLQALQKAAKTREEGDGEAVAGALPLDDGLGLEPLPEEPTLRDEMDGPPPATASATPAQAATVMQAGRAAPGFDPLDYIREHYMLSFLATAVLFAMGYGTYVYLQVARPFSSPPAPAPVVVAAPVVAAAPAAEPAKISGLPESISPTSPSATTTPAAASGEKSASSDQSVSATEISEPVRQKAPRISSPRKRVLAKTAAEPSDSIETVEIQSPRSATETAIRRDGVDLVPVSSTLTQAYQALIAGNEEKARTLYQEVLAAEPRSIDALLGLGTIAWKHGHAEEASKYYQRVLQLEPRNSYAQAGLIAIVGGADPEAAESRLKQLISRDPSAFLHFTLGNLYAERGLWAAAQQSYFQAHQMQSDYPDYAFNLAVGLEHLGQERLALAYYRKALDLSFKRGHANFDQSLVIQRVAQLSARVEQ